MYETLTIETDSRGVATLTLNRPEKRNALDVITIEELIRFFSGARMAGVKAVLLEGAGDHFCAGLDLVEHWKADRSPDDFMHVCLRWHEANDLPSLSVKLSVTVAPAWSTTVTGR